MRLIFFSLFCYVFIAIISLPKLAAQTTSTFNGWGAVFSTVKLNNKLSIYFDGQARSNDKWERIQTVLLRPGLHYQVNSKQIATIGYAYVQQLRSSGDITTWEPEHRIWEQYIFNQGFAIGGHATSLQHRLRLEQRFVPKMVLTNNELAKDGYLFSQRFRYFARSIFPLQSCVKFNKGMFVSLQDEVMLNVTNASNVNDKFFDQNRAYVSLGYRLSSKADIEVGYMNQYVAGRNDIRTSNNILQLAVYLRL